MKKLEKLSMLNIHKLDKSRMRKIAGGVDTYHVTRYLSPNPDRWDNDRTGEPTRYIVIY